MTSKRTYRRGTLHTPALARTHRLGEALTRAMHESHLTAPAMQTRRTSFAPVGWGTAPTWRHGRVLSRVPSLAQPQWSAPARPQLARVGAQSGVALLELMLVIGVITVATGAVVATYKVVDNNSKINEEVEHAQTITNNIVAASVTRGDFSIINQENAIRDGVFPAEMMDTTGNPKSAWGGDVLVTATNIAGKSNWGTVLTFEGVPARACAKLVTQAASGFYGVTVENQTVRTNYGPVDVAALTALCNRDAGARVQFIYAKHGGAGESFDQVSPCTVPAPETDVVVDAACPTGQLGTITYRTDYVCQSPYGPATDLPAVEVSNTCTPACILPSPSTQRNDETRTNSQTLACPSGQLSTTPGGGIYQTRTETRYQTRDASCPASPGYSAPVGPYAWSTWSAFTPWTATTPWATQTNSCAPVCVVPSPSTETDTENRTNTQTLACPAGQLGQIDQSRPEYRTRTRTASCPAPTGSATWTVWGAWSAWTASAPWSTTSNTCAPQCVLPTPQTETNSETRTVSQIVACPTGQVAPNGSANGITQQRTEKRDQTRTASCPAPTGPYTWSPYGAFGPWYATTPWSTTGNVCAPQCVLPSPSTETNTETRTNTQTFSCAPGDIITTTGPAQWQATGPQTRTEQRSQTRTASCPAPTGSYTWSAYTAFTAWSGTTPWSPAYTCAPACVAPPPQVTSSSQTNLCLSGRKTPTGGSTFTQTRTTTVSYTCPSPVGNYTTNPAVVSPWSPTEAEACAPACVAPAPTTQTQAGTPGTQVAMCPSGQYGQLNQSRSVTETRTVTYSCPAPTGPASATYGPWGAPYSYGAWTTTSGTCTNCPAPSTDTAYQWVPATGTCPSGQYGSTSYEKQQSQSRSVSYNCPAGTTTLPPATYGAFGPWSDTGTTRNTVANCTACPAPVNTTEYQNVPASANCPSGQYGTNTWQAQQSRTKTVSYNCPAGTSTLPASTTSYTPWTNTGVTSSVVNTCAACPAPSTQSQTQWVAATGSCPAGQAGTYSWEKEQTQSRSVSYTCPAGTSTLPPATYGTWGAWTDTGNTRNVVNTCAPVCSAPPATTQSNSQTAYCTSGRVTPSGANSFTQTQTRSVTYSCPAPTGPYATTYGPWSAFSPTEAQACAPQCVAPANTTEYSTGTREFQGLACPYFQTGTISQYRDPYTYRSVTYSCPSPTGAYSTSYGPWYVSGYSPWTTYSNTCALPACDGTLAGNARNYESRYGDLYNAFGTNYTAAYNHWWQSGYYEGRTSCWAGPCSPPAPVTQWLTASDNACPAGTAGTRTYEYEQRADGTCASPTGPAGYGGWYNTGNTRNINTSQCTPTASPCTVTAGSLSRSWTGGRTCSGTIPGGTYPSGSYATIYVQTSLKTGQASYQCINGTFGTTPSNYYCEAGGTTCPSCVVP